MNLNLSTIVSACDRFLLSPEARAGFSQFLEFIAEDTEIQDPRHAAYMLATVKHECADTWQPIEERGRGQGRPYGAPVTIVANGVTYTNVYYGRGYGQITWIGNYSRMSEALGLGNLLVVHPEMMLEPRTAYPALSLGMRKGMFTGVGLSRFIHDDECDYVNARKIINGLDQAEKIAEYAKGFQGMLDVGPWEMAGNKEGNG